MQLAPHRAVAHARCFQRVAPETPQEGAVADDHGKRVAAGRSSNLARRSPSSGLTARSLCNSPTQARMAVTAQGRLASTTNIRPDLRGGRPAQLTGRNR
jgi:hypothetical protein